MSVDYPQLQVVPSNGETTCIIMLPKHSTGSIVILDVGYNFTQESTCPVRIAVREEYRCPESGTQIYPGFDLKPLANQEDINFYDVELKVTTNTHSNQLKLWLEVAGKLICLFYYSVHWKKYAVLTETISVYHLRSYSLQCSPGLLHFWNASFLLQFWSKCSPYIYNCCDNNNCSNNK